MQKFKKEIIQRKIAILSSRQTARFCALLSKISAQLMMILSMALPVIILSLSLTTLSLASAQVSPNSLDLLQQATLQTAAINHPAKCSPPQKNEDAKRITIGVLAPYGDEIAEREWCAWIQSLNRALPELHFILKPLQINSIEAEVNSGTIDLLLSHQGVFVNLHTETPIRWTASLEENIHLEDTNAKIGSSIWVNHDSDIRTLQDLQGKDVGAVSSKALGGFLLAYHEMMKNAPELRKNIHFQYHGFPIETLFNKLANHENEAIIVPACLYERLERQDILPDGNFRLINSKEIADFDCQTSTNLLPSWSLAALDSLDSDIAKRIQAELFKETDPHLPTWQLPFTLAEISQLTYDVKVFEGAETLFETLFRLAVTNKVWLLFFALFLLILLVNHLWLSYAATKRRKQLDSAYKVMHDYEAMLSKADRMNILGEMASGIGHELNQPLSTIRNYAQGSMMILKKENNAHPLLMPLQKINEQVSQCHNIIKNLRSWAKPKESSIRESVNLRLFLERIIEITRLRMRSNIEITVNVPDDFELVLTPSILEQVIANCLMNSAQAGATTIEIRTKIYDKFIKLFLFDNGPGFNPSELNAPFVPFRTSKEDGLGLGLVICQRLIESLDGKLRIANRKDGQQGAAVRLILSRELVANDQANTVDSNNG